VQNVEGQTAALSQNADKLFMAVPILAPLPHPPGDISANAFVLLDLLEHLLELGLEELFLRMVTIVCDLQKWCDQHADVI
jgi:hypothetical protein